jgi:hypothetical protein
MPKASGEGVETAGSLICLNTRLVLDVGVLGADELAAGSGTSMAAQPILRIDNKTGSSDLPVGRFVDRRVESYF